jgi:6-phosphogluconolactonase
VYFGDERACPPEDPESNYRLARESLLDRVPIQPSLVYRMEGEAPDLDAAASDYSSLLRSSRLPGPGGAPRLDCVLLGLGADGHTASLFPGTPALEVADSWCTRGVAPAAPVDRLTLTLPVLNAAAAVAFCVTGAGKAEALQRVATGEGPAARVTPAQGKLLWFLDQAAAGNLSANRVPLPGSL